MKRKLVLVLAVSHVIIIFAIVLGLSLGTGKDKNSQEIQGLDECALELDDCSQYAVCTSTPAGYSCFCNKGYVGDGKNCIVNALDFDECAEGTAVCQTNSTCNNVPNDYECLCDEGLEGDGKIGCTDIDECAQDLDSCDSTISFCRNLVPSFECMCNHGYQSSGPHTCVDTDECALGTHNCHANATCGNIDGSYTCTCNSGYAGSGTTCEDVNECLAGADNCDMNAICKNTVGSFECTCDEFHIGDGITCTDKDECALDTHNCHSNATCTNTDGGFTCACNSGYTGIGHTCTDINECLANTRNCDENALCTNTDGSFECACDEFWTGDGLICTDIDECDSAAIIECENEGDNVVCVNHVGADYTCECNPTGYRDTDNSDEFNCVVYAGDPAKCADYHLAANCPDGTVRNSGNQGNCNPERGCAESCCTAATCLLWMAQDQQSCSLTAGSNPKANIESIACPDGTFASCDVALCCQNGGEVAATNSLTCTRNNELIDFEDQGYVLADDDEAVSPISDIEFRSVYPGTFTSWVPTGSSSVPYETVKLESALDTSAPNAFPAGDELDNCPTTADTDGLGTVGEWMIRTSQGSSTNRASMLIVLPDNNPTNELAAYIYDIRQRQGSGEFNPFIPQWYISSYDQYYRPVGSLHSPKGSEEQNCTMNALAFNPWEFVVTSTSTHPIKYVRIDFIGFRGSAGVVHGLSLDNIRPYGCNDFAGQPFAR